MLDSQALDAAILANDIDEAIKLTGKLGKRKNTSAVPFLIEHMLKTDSHALRNHIAIALSDIGNSAALSAIVSLLKDTKTAGSRGTLVYALEGFNISGHLDVILDLLFDPGWEASREALHVIESRVDHIPSQTRQDALSRLSKEIDGLEDQLEFFKAALDIIQKK